jgi:hypothetical protein
VAGGGGRFRVAGSTRLMADGLRTQSDCDCGPDLSVGIFACDSMRFASRKADCLPYSSLGMFQQYSVCVRFMESRRFPIGSCCKDLVHQGKGASSSTPVGEPHRHVAGVFSTTWNLDCKESLHRKDIPNWRLMDRKHADGNSAHRLPKLPCRNADADVNRGIPLRGHNMRGRGSSTTSLL